MARPLWLLLALALCAPAAACQRGGRGAEIPAQPIRDEKEPGETVDTVGAVPDSGGGSSSSSSSSSEIEVDLEDESASSAKSDKPDESADASKDEEGDSSDTGDTSVEIEIDEDE